MRIQYIQNMSCEYVSLMQNLKLYFSWWPQHIDFIKTCQYLTVNSQILNVFFESAVDLCNLCDEIALFLVKAVPIYL